MDGIFKFPNRCRIGLDLFCKFALDESFPSSTAVVIVVKVMVVFVLVLVEDMVSPSRIHRTQCCDGSLEFWYMTCSLCPIPHRISHGMKTRKWKRLDESIGLNVVCIENAAMQEDSMMQSCNHK